MPKTKRETDTAEKRPTKSQKLEENEPFVPRSLDDINDHCVLEIFKCLSVEVLNSVAVFISKRFNELRNHDSLDQTRTGTIVCTENTTVESIRNAFVAQQWNQVFTGNRTHLKVVGLDRMPDINTRVQRSADYLLPNVSCLDIAITPVAQGETQEISSHRNAEAFATMLPNLEEIDVSYSRTPTTLLFHVVSAYRKIKRIKCNTSRNQIDMTGGTLATISDSLMELCLDNSQLFSLIPGMTSAETYENEDEADRYLLRHCSSLDRLSIKNVSWIPKFHGEEEVSQAMLIKMVRHHPTLRWLRSDLTQENITMLQQERPDITFVSD